ncbi:15745_t:CDS:1, partial [Gigaspora margarita]
SEKKPGWFTKLEELCIANKNTRELREVFKQEDENNLVIRPELKMISSDRHKHEVIVIKNTKDTIQIEKIKILKNRNKTLLIKHWKEKNINLMKTN